MKQAYDIKRYFEVFLHVILHLFIDEDIIGVFPQSKT